MPLPRMASRLPTRLEERLVPSRSQISPSGVFKALRGDNHSRNAPRWVQSASPQLTPFSRSLGRLSREAAELSSGCDHWPKGSAGASLQIR
jgi:hypothetical protein